MTPLAGIQMQLSIPVRQAAAATPDAKGTRDHRGAKVDTVVGAFHLLLVRFFQQSM